MLERSIERGMNMECRIIVFGTSDICVEDPVFPGQRAIHEEGRERWYSTGRLERALTMGIEICVCSVRPAFGPHDAWWQKHVPPERVFAPKLDVRMSGDDFKDRVLFEPWRRFFAHAGLEWPDDGRDGLDVRRDLDGSQGVLHGGRLSGFSGAA